MKRLFLLLPLLGFLAGCSHRIESGLSEREAQEIVITLRENGIEAVAEPDTLGKKENALWQVTIKGSEEAAAWKVLREHGLPHEKVQGLDDVFKNAGMIPTSTEEKARMVVGLAGELTRTLRSVPGVVDARVHVVLPDTTSLVEKKDQNSTTASVLVRYRGEHSPLTDEEIRGLVAKGVEGLTMPNVDVVQKRATEKPLPPGNTGPLGGTQWTAALALGLAAVSGTGAVSMLVVSKRRGVRIKTLERQLSQATETRLQGTGRI